MDTPKIEFKNMRWITVINAVMVVLLLFTILYIIGTFTDKTSPDYHQTGAMGGLIVVGTVAAVYGFFTDRMRQSVRFENAVLTYTRGHYLKNRSVIDLRKLTFIHGFSLPGRYGTAVNWGLELSDDAGHSVSLVLNAFNLKYRRELVSAMKPYLENPTVHREGEDLIQKALTTWTQHLSDTVAGRQFPDDMS